jgi:hypothetical protein
LHILLGQLAKAKVAGSNLVFRSNTKGPDAADFASAPVRRLRHFAVFSTGHEKRG